MCVPLYLVAAVAVGTAPAAPGGSDGAGAATAAVASVPAHLVVVRDIYSITLHMPSLTKLGFCLSLFGFYLL